MLDLIRRGADINTKDKNGDTALSIAINSNYQDQKELLHKNGADITLVKNTSKKMQKKFQREYQQIKINSENFCSLCNTEKYIEAKSILDNKKINVNYTDRHGNTPLIYASQNRLTEIAIKLLKNGARVNVKNNDGITPLIYATENGLTELSLKLIEYGADVNCQDNDQITPLMNAIGKQLTEVVQVLLEKGANLTFLDCSHSGKDFPFFAPEDLSNYLLIKRLIDQGNTDIFKLLIEEVDQKNFLSHNGRSLLMLSVNKGYTDIPELLLKKGIEVNFFDENNLSPLMAASINGYIKIVKLLIDKKATVSIKNNSGKTALDLIQDKTEPIYDQIRNLLENELSKEHEIDINSKEFCELCSTGNTEEVNKYLDSKKINVNYTDRHGNTPLIYASQNRLTEIAIKLLKKGARVNVKNNNGITPLIYATENGLTELSLKLIEYGADVNCQDNNQITPLMNAIEKQLTEVVQVLLEKGANLTFLDCSPSGKDFSFFAPENLSNYLLTRKLIDQGNTDIFKLLIEKEDRKNFLSYYGRSLLMSYVNKGYTDIAELLLKKGIEVNFFDENNLSPLMAASMNGYIKIVKLLIDKKATVSIKNNSGKTALDLIQDKTEPIYDQIRNLLENELSKEHEIDINSKEFCELCSTGDSEKANKYLDSKNINVNYTDHYGNTPLIYASQNRLTEIAIKLLKKGARVNVKNNNGITPLIYATENGLTELSLKLIEYGADVNCQDNNQITPLMNAIEKQLTEVVQVLLEKGANLTFLNCSPSGKDFPFFATENFVNYFLISYIIDQGNTDIFKLLIEKGDWKNFLSYHGRSLLMSSVNKGYTDIAELLLKKGVKANFLDENNLSPLMSATIKGHISTAKLLLKHKAIVNQKNEAKNTALIYAAKNGFTEIAQVLIDKGADINVEDAFKNTPLMLSIKNEDVKMVQILLNHKDIKLDVKNDDEETILSCAKKAKRKKIYELIVSKLNLQQKSSFDKTKTKPKVHLLKNNFWEAVNKGDVNEIDLLFEKKDDNGAVIIDINERNKNGDTAIILAAKNGHNLVIQSLLEKNADIFLKNKQGDNALLIAVDNNNYNAIKLILAKIRDNLSLKNIEGVNALIKASEKGDNDVVALLLDKGVNPNPKEAEILQKTPLMASAENGHIDIVNILIDHGAKVSTKNNSGKTALDLIKSKTEPVYEQLRRILKAKLKTGEQPKSGLQMPILIKKQTSLELITTNEYDKQLEDWKVQDESIASKIQSLVDDMQKNPLNSFRQTESLKGNLRPAFKKNKP